MADLIDKGNEFLKKGKFKTAIKKYVAALSTKDLPPNEQARAHNNKSQTEYIQKNFTDSFESSKKVLEILPKNIKARLRICKILFLQKKRIASCKEFLYLIKNSNYPTILSSKNPSARDKKLLKSVKSFESDLRSKIAFLSLENVIAVIGKHFSSIVNTKLQMLRIEEKELHDIWKLHDYFDGKSEGSKYVNCPRELFCKFDVPNTLNYFFQFSIAQMRGKCAGFFNVMVASVLMDVLKEHKHVFFGNEKVIGVSLVRSLFMGKSVIYHAINNNGIVRRDYEEHFWIQLNLDNEKKVFIDFMGAVFGHFDYFEDSGFPIRIFNEKNVSEFKLKESISGKDLRRFCNDKYYKEYLKKEASKTYNKTLVSIEKELKIQKILKENLFSFS